MERFSFKQYAFASIAACLLSVGYAAYLYDDFYLCVAHLTTSKLGLLVSYNFVFVCLVAIGKLLLLTFIGTLRDLELEQLVDIGRTFLTDSILFLALTSPTIEGQSVSTVKLVQFVSFLMALKAFHIIAQFRVQHVFEIGVPRLGAIVRLCIMILCLVLVDLIALSHFYGWAFQDSSFYLWLFFETLGMLCSGCVSLLKYTVHIVDIRLENGWPGKTAHLFFLDLVNDVASHVIFLVFMAMFPLNHSNFYENGGPDWEMTFFLCHALVDVIQVLRTLRQKLVSYARFRKLVKNMETKFPDATLSELESADVCIICRDILSEGSKKLPCSHVFHLDCLKSWFIQQQSCPTCRTDIPTGGPPAPVPPTEAPAPNTPQNTEGQGSAQEHSQGTEAATDGVEGNEMSLHDTKMRQLEEQFKPPPLEKASPAGAFKETKRMHGPSSQVPAQATRTRHKTDDQSAASQKPTSWLPIPTQPEVDPNFFDTLQHAAQMSEFYRKQAEMWFQICANQTSAAWESSAAQSNCSSCGLMRRPTDGPRENTNDYGEGTEEPQATRTSVQAFNPFFPHPMSMPPSPHILSVFATSNANALSVPPATPPTFPPFMMGHPPPHCEFPDMLGFGSPQTITETASQNENVPPLVGVDGAGAPETQTQQEIDELDAYRAHQRKLFEQHRKAEKY